MAYGVAPGTEVKVWDVASHFFYHYNQTWSNRPTFNQRQAVARDMKRLLDIYPPESIKRAIDRFYMTRTSKNHPEPGFAFCSRKFQEVLFAGVDVLDDQDAIMKWMKTHQIPAGRVADLPWDGEFDQEVAIEMITTPVYNVFLRTYPDIVAEILKNYHDKDWIDIMDQVCWHMNWLLGIEDEPSTVLPELQEKFHLPKDFLEKGKMRKTQDTVEEAVRVSRGR